MQFGWNRKRRKLRDKAGLPFESAGGSVSLEEDGTPNLFSLTSGANYVPSEEALKQSLEIQAEGNTQAENGLFREALKRWERALDLTPERAVLHELKAQVLLEMDAVWQAVRSAKKATEFDPEWSEGFITLGRAHFNYGEPELAAENFQRALQLDACNSIAQEELDTVRLYILRRKELADKGEIVTGTRFSVLTPAHQVEHGQPEQPPLSGNAA
ncbi:hypothetical protein CYMTET_31002 [Cymbomonas tetramitiformis]|uniref:Tetratricopeptide repeat protein n=1 Tax=Cymbomonas tetramitiformis TaxID=36881 RepID=A0AAE0KTC5_9CHLO|nr:hypothetical protein CYMTET_31002 [Cymbomonas tetramitiformis]